MSRSQQSRAGKQRAWRTRIRRLAFISKTLRDRRHINCSILAAEFEITVKTVWRDIELLRDLGQQIEYDSVRFTLFYASMPDRLL